MKKEREREKKEEKNFRTVYYHTYKNVTRTRRHTTAQCCAGWIQVPGKEGCQRG